MTYTMTDAVIVIVVVAIVVVVPLYRLWRDQQNHAPPPQIPEPAIADPEMAAAPRMTEPGPRRPPIHEGPIILHYKDAEGKITDRVVNPISFDDALFKDGRRHPAVLHAYCHHAKAPRSFRLDRVQLAADQQTGEVIPDLRAWPTR